MIITIFFNHPVKNYVCCTSFLYTQISIAKLLLKCIKPNVTVKHLV